MSASQPDVEATKRRATKRKLGRAAQGGGGPEEVLISAPSSGPQTEVPSTTIGAAATFRGSRSERAGGHQRHQHGSLYTGSRGGGGRANLPPEAVCLPLTSNVTTSTSSHISVQTIDYSTLQLKEGATNRPLLVCPNGFILMETHRPLSGPAGDFLIAVAEPLSRPELIHEFQLTVFSLYAALSMGISVAEILQALNMYSKNLLPDELCASIKFHGGSFGQVKLVLRDSRYFIESSHRSELELMVSHPLIASARIKNSLSVRSVRSRPAVIAVPKVAPSTEGPSEDTVVALEDEDFELQEAPDLDKSLLDFMQQTTGVKTELELKGARPTAAAAADAKLAATAAETGVDKNQTKLMVYSFEIVADKVSAVREASLRELNRPLLMEYDFKRDTRNPDLDIALRPTTKVRYYQERALRKMFSNGRARSGIIVLPCGAGKTLTGIVASTTTKKSTMVLTSSAVAVDQWRRAFLEFTTVDPQRVICITADSKTDLPEDGGVIVCSTYYMMAYSGKRSESSERITQQIRKREWGLLIFDEVQFAPAPAFRKINEVAKSHCKLGLTATLVREDELINDLHWLIGPKLDEANWLELQEAGYLARVKCSEVWCPMTFDYYRAYLEYGLDKQRTLWVCNPNKLRVCEYLIRFHEARRDKIIVFSDNLFALKEVALTMKKPYISGEVGLQERMIIINKFKLNSEFNTILLSKVGDNAIDIPCANVIIQISFNFASRRQEAQRLGRILRPKPGGMSEEFNAFFYSLVSKDTQEMAYADRRQQFIIDQGYAYKVFSMDVFPLKGQTLSYDDPVHQGQLLARILTESASGDLLEQDDVILSKSDITAQEQSAIAQSAAGGRKPQSPAAGGTRKRLEGGLSGLTGGRSRKTYTETGKFSAAAVADMHPMFRKVYAQK